ncbi:MAG: ArsR family transcriptional regulator [Armatimonadetes bacterium]|nr:ArsR family transcriptional regulator [Armatimonadota bacterium]
MSRSVNPTRWEILTTLKKQGELTVEELSAHLGTSAMTVRYHLSALRAAGLVRARSRRGGIGRPVAAYQITEAADEMFPRRYDALAVDILTELEETEGAARIEAIFARGEAKLYERYASRLEGKSFEEKVAEVARILDENGYLTAWRREGDVFVLTEHNCAVAQVAQRYAHPCHYEEKLLERFLGTEVRRVQHKVAGHHCCAYVIPVPEEQT